MVYAIAISSIANCHSPLENKIEMQDKIRFRDLVLDDITSLCEIYSDKEAMKYRGSKPIETTEDAKEYISNQKLLKGSVLTIRKGIELLNPQELMGSVMYRFDKTQEKECEIGYSIGRKFWGKGFGKEIVKMLLESIQENKDIQNVIAWTNKENIASIKILERNGFQRVEQDNNSANYLYRKTKK